MLGYLSLGIISNTPKDNGIKCSFLFLDATDTTEYNDHSDNALHACTVHQRPPTAFNVSPQEMLDKLSNVPRTLLFSTRRSTRRCVHLP